MPIEQITIPVSSGSGVRHQVQVLEKKLGDGYTQRAAEGLNNVVLKYEAVWTGLGLAEAGELVQFFNRHQGIKPFLVKELPEPLKAKKWVCKDWSEEWVSAERRNVRALLEEDFSL